MGVQNGGVGELQRSETRPVVLSLEDSLPMNPSVVEGGPRNRRTTTVSRVVLYSGLDRPGLGSPSCINFSVTTGPPHGPTAPRGLLESTPVPPLGPPLSGKKLFLVPSVVSDLSERLFPVVRWSGPFETDRGWGVCPFGLP